MSCAWAAAALGGFGFLQILRGLWNMSHGTGKCDE